jgi:molecular chaperone HscB
MPVNRMHNYFELFGLPVSFDIDPASLSERYRDLQRHLHPDKFATATAEERRLSLQKTAHVNEAFRTLKEPVRRARHLLEVNGVRWNDESETIKNPKFLMEQMELRENLDEARIAADVASRLRVLSTEAERRLSEKIAAFREAVQRGPGALVQARETVREMQFLQKLLDEIRELEDEVG